MFDDCTISELEPLWIFMAFSCTFPITASAHRAKEMRRTPACHTHLQLHLIQQMKNRGGGGLLILRIVGLPFEFE